jgi:hypothetical protein
MCGNYIERPFNKYSENYKIKLTGLPSGSPLRRGKA